MATTPFSNGILLPFVHQRLKTREPVIYSGPKRAAVAIIFRFPTPQNRLAGNVEGSITVEEFLVIRRAVNPRDRWSGQIALPGGRQDKGESDQTTAEREVLEEVGLDLRNQRNFLLLGRIDDRRLGGNIGKLLGKGLVISVFVYLQVCAQPVDLALDTREVAEAWWVPVTAIHPAFPSRSASESRVSTLCIPLSRRVPALSHGPMKVLATVLGVDEVHFPVLALPSPSSHDRTVADPAFRMTACTFQPTDQADHCILWGLTLTIIRDLVVSPSLPPLIATSLPTFRRPWFNFVVHLAYGPLSLAWLARLLLCGFAVFFATWALRLSTSAVFESGPASVVV